MIFVKRVKQKGAALVEYGLLVALIAVLSIGAITGLGEGVQESFSATCETLATIDTDDGGNGTADACE